MALLIWEVLPSIECFHRQSLTKHAASGELPSWEEHWSFAILSRAHSYVPGHLEVISTEGGPSTDAQLLDSFDRLFRRLWPMFQNSCVERVLILTQKDRSMVLCSNWCFYCSFAFYDPFDVVCRWIVRPESASLLFPADLGWCTCETSDVTGAESMAGLLWMPRW